MSCLWTIAHHGGGYRFCPCVIAVSGQRSTIELIPVGTVGRNRTDNLLTENEEPFLLATTAYGGLGEFRNLDNHLKRVLLCL